MRMYVYVFIICNYIYIYIERERVVTHVKPKQTQPAQAPPQRTEAGERLAGEPAAQVKTTCAAQQ